MWNLNSGKLEGARAALPHTVNPQNFSHDSSVFYLFTIFFHLQVFVRKIHYSTTVLHYVTYIFSSFLFSLSPLPTKIK